MTPLEAFSAFVKFAIVPAKADRMAILASTKGGQQKILDSLPHEFDSAIRSESVQTGDYRKLWNKPCFGFHSQLGFGAPFATVREAYDWLSKEDSWLIVLQDGSAGIHCTEDGWYHQKLIVR
jgi:hypothetical protein